MIHSIVYYITLATMMGVFGVGLWTIARAVIKSIRE
jgi:hypothetical protein